MPAGPGLRVDAGVEAGTHVRPEYDPLLAKLLVHAADRPAAVARLRRALDETLIGGVQTDLGFHRWLVDEPGFATGDYDTSLVADRWGSGPALTDEEMRLAASAARDARLAAAPTARIAPRGPGAGESAWAAQARREATER